MNWFEIVIAVVLLYCAASLRTVGPKELGCILRFRKPLKNVFSGLHFVPFVTHTLVLETRLVIQDELPAEPEKIYRGIGEDSGQTVSKELQQLGWKPPIRITFSDRNKESEVEKIDKEDPYDRRLTAEVVPVVRWRIEDFKTFLETIGSIDGEKGARKQLEDACVKTFTELLTRVTPAVALRRIGKYSRILQKRLEKLTDSWGIKIESAQIKGINFSHKLNAAVQNVVEQERNMAAKILEGKGQGGREQAILDGRTAGLAKMLEDLGVDGEAVLGAETARAIAGEGDKSSQRTIIAGSGGFTDLIGTAVAIGESLKTKPKQGE